MHLYDAIYSFKDYDSESARVLEIIKERSPEAKTLLDVACGTGKHLERLARDLDVQGLDIDPAFLDAAAQRLPGVPLHQADMVTFDLGRTFDVVTCLFSAVAHLLTLENLRAAIANMARHVNPGGLVIIEPFIPPEEWQPDHVSLNQVDEQDLKVARITRSWRDGESIVMDMQFLVGTPDGIEHYCEEIPLRLAAGREFEEAFVRGGLEVDFDPAGLMGRGLYIGKKPPPS